MDGTIAFWVTMIVVVVTVGTLVYLARSRSSIGDDTRVTEGRLSKAASSLGSALRKAWGSGINEETWDGIEEALVAADVGVGSASEIVAQVKAGRPGDAREARSLLADQLRRILADRDRSFKVTARPGVVLVVGVNGTGKTTSIAKLGSLLKNEGKSVIFAAADTFRAAAGEQLRSWGSRVGVNVVGGHEGGDPAAVVYDALESARAKGADVVIVDTAGRLHGKKNLMAELEKIHRVAAGGAGTVDEVLLVLDATSGQNGLTQVKEFASAVPITGIILTKLDGTARGGIVIAIERELGVPVKFVGLGEGIADLATFDPDSFVEELLEQS